MLPERETTREDEESREYCDILACAVLDTDRVRDGVALAQPDALGVALGCCVVDVERVADRDTHGEGEEDSDVDTVSDADGVGDRSELREAQAE